MFVSEQSGEKFSKKSMVGGQCIYLLKGLMEDLRGRGRGGDVKNSIVRAGTGGLEWARRLPRKTWVTKWGMKNKWIDFWRAKARI